MALVSCAVLGFLSVSIDEFAGERLMADWGWPGVGQSLLCMVGTKIATVDLPDRPWLVE